MRSPSAARASMQRIMQKMMSFGRQIQCMYRLPLGIRSICAQQHLPRNRRPSRGFSVASVFRESAVIPDRSEQEPLAYRERERLEHLIAGSSRQQPATAGEPLEQRTVVALQEASHSDASRGTNLRLPNAAKHRKARLGARSRPWTALHGKLQQSLASRKLLDTEAVLVAVSGGQDSVCLLQALVDLQPVWRWRLGVVHCDHGWRPDSAANADFVRAMAEQRFGLPCHVRVAPPGAVPNERAAREWRYAAFTDVAAAHGYGIVVTGHTATDRAETMLLNLLRGSGPDGLVALARSRPLGPAASVGAQPLCGGEHCKSSSSSNGNGHVASDHTAGNTGGDGCTQGADAMAVPAPRLVRPLLEFSRAETLEFVEMLGLPYFHDSTNDCNDLRRNRLRNEVLPALRLGFNPRLDQALFRFVEVLSAEMDYLEHVTDELYDIVVWYGQGRPGQMPDGSGNSSGTLPSGSCNGSAYDCLGRSGSGSPSGSESGPGPGGGMHEVYVSSAGALQLAQLRLLPLAMQRRVVRRWLELALGGAQGATGGCNEGSNGPGPGNGGTRGQVRYEDVARCLALLHAPNRTNSDSLCAGLVATVRDGYLVLRRLGMGGPGPSASRQQQQQQYHQQQKQQKH